MIGRMVEFLMSAAPFNNGQAILLMTICVSIGRIMEMREDK